MAQRLVRLQYREIVEARGGGTAQGLPCLRDAIAPGPYPHELEIVNYLETAPNYCAMGKVVHDALDPECKSLLFPGTNTDGVYLWPMELAYYVQKYHLRLPSDFVERMASLEWEPPIEDKIDIEELSRRLLDDA